MLAATLQYAFGIKLMATDSNVSTTGQTNSAGNFLDTSATIGDVIAVDTCDDPDVNGLGNGRNEPKAPLNVATASNAPG